MKARLDSIQVLRAMAVVGVVFCHAQWHIEEHTAKFCNGGEAWLNIADPLKTGQCGVDIFFVISGFIIALITDGLHRRKYAIKSFARKRLTRILPTYWLWTLTMIFLLFLFSPDFARQVIGLKEAALSLLLIPYSSAGGVSAPILAPAWTLSYEMYFYMLACVGLLFSRKQFIFGLGAFFLISTVIFPQNYGPLSRAAANLILWEFFAGLLLFEVYKTGKRIPLILSVGFSVCALVMFHCFAAEAHSNLRFIYWGIPALILVSSFVLAGQTGPAPKILVFLGDSSYSLYLTHSLTLAALGRLLPMSGLQNALPPDLSIIFVTFICAVVGCLLYAIIEKPMLYYLRKRTGLQSCLI